MIESRIKLYNGLSVLTDLTAAGLAFAGAVQYASVIPYILGTDGLVYLNLRAFTALGVSALAIAAVHLTFSVLYQNLKSPYGTRNIWRLFPRVIGLGLADLAIVWLSFFLFKAAPPNQDFYLAFELTLVAGTVILRVIVQRLLAWRFAATANHVNILIVGTNERAMDFYRFTMANRFLGFRVAGFLDDLNRSGHDHVRILAPLAGFERVARENILDLVVVFLPIRSYYDKVSAIIEHASIQGIPVQHMYVLFDHKNLNMSARNIGDHSGMFIGSAPSNPWLLGIKRIFDIVFSLLVLVCISPVLLAAAIAIKIDSRGPVFFVQSRVGYHKRPIRVLKLRTMVSDAEKLMSQLESLNEMDGPVFKIHNDPRITRVGRLLRRYNIDELPQFINVLLGDMSVVGPRPMSERDYLGFSEDWLRKRFSIAPGITCLWQVRPHRNQIPFHEWMNLDMEYIDNWSLWLDMKIIVQTVLTTLGGTGT